MKPEHVAHRLTSVTCGPAVSPGSCSQGNRKCQATSGSLALRRCRTGGSGPRAGNLTSREKLATCLDEWSKLQNDVAAAGTIADHNPKLTSRFELWEIGDRRRLVLQVNDQRTKRPQLQVGRAIETEEIGRRTSISADSVPVFGPHNGTHRIPMMV